MGDENKVRPRVLVVDDELGILKLAEEILKDRYVVDTAANATAARARFAAHRPDLVITDVRMPGESGLELLKALKAQAAEVPVIVMTAYKNKQSIIESFRAGARSFLAKPFTPDELEGIVNKALGGNEQTADLPIELNSPLEGWVELSAPSHEQYLERFQEFCAQLYASRLDEKTQRDIQIAVDEMGRNAIEWGNRKDVSRKIHMAYCMFDDRIVFKIEDEGEGFDTSKVPDPTKDPLGVVLSREAAGKRPGGYGLAMCRKIMDAVYYNGKGNMIIMEKRFPV